MRRRKVVYPPPKTATKGGAAPNTDARAAAAASRVVSIDLTAMRGRADLVPGMRVEITGGVHAGQQAVIESVAGGVIPAVVVRTDGGPTRRVRVVDLAPLPNRPRDPAERQE